VRILHQVSVRRLRSNSFDDDAMGVRGQRFEIVRVRRQDRAAWLSNRHDQRVDRGTAPGAPAQRGGASRKALRDPIQHIAGLQKLVLVRISASMPLKALDKDDGWNGGGPQAFFSEGNDECCRRPGSLCKTTYGTGVENEQR
jgi:hypothetical protein